MRIITLLLLTLISIPSQAKECSSLLDHTVRTLDEKRKVNLCEVYQGKVILVVNTASKCAYTDQYDDLEKLYERYKDRDFVVLGFPSNDFGAQEPGTERQIKKFCRLTYGVRFPMFAKTRVTEYAADPLYRSLADASGNYPRWNFHKYLIGRDGKLVADYMSAINPFDERILNDIEENIGSRIF